MNTIKEKLLDENIHIDKYVSCTCLGKPGRPNPHMMREIMYSLGIHNNPRTPKEIATIFKLDNTSATKGCKNAVHLINNIDSSKNKNDKTYFHQTKPIASHIEA